MITGWTMNYIDNELGLLDAETIWQVHDAEIALKNMPSLHKK